MNYITKLSLRTWFLAASVIFIATTLSGCPDVYDQGGYSRPGGYYDPYGGYNSGYGGYDSYGRDDYRRRELERERRGLERERDRAEAERERAEDERRRLEEARDALQRRPPPPQPQADRCPSGFSPSEQKCSSEERKRGCKDVRLPSGLGCVRR